MRKDTGEILRAAKGLRTMRGRCAGLWTRLKLHLTRERVARLCWYASLAGLLVLLGTASYRYRNRPDGAPSADVPPVEALAQLTPAPSAEPEDPGWVWPVEGEIIGAFAPESLAWCETLGQWQSHAAIDIAAEPGEAVAACADGTVTDAWRDPLWGNVITIEHEDGWQSTCAGVSTLELVAPGDKVQAGQVISAVGDTAACEAEMPWHLHFELNRDGEAVDFSAIMAQIAQ